MNQKLFYIYTTIAICLTIYIAAAQNPNQINKNKPLIETKNNTLSVINYYKNFNSQSYQLSQHQQTTINLNSNDTKQPCILSIYTAKSTQIAGQITVNNVLIQKFKNNLTSVNLSPYLSKGVKTVEILGSYKPTSASVRLKVSTPSTKVSQQTSGSGILKQTLIIKVH